MCRNFLDINSFVDSVPDVRRVVGNLRYRYLPDGTGRTCPHPHRSGTGRGETGPQLGEAFRRPSCRLTVPIESEGPTDDVPGESWDGDR